MRTIQLERLVSGKAGVSLTKETVKDKEIKREAKPYE